MRLPTEGMVSRWGSMLLLITFAAPSLAQPSNVPLPPPRPDRPAAAADTAKPEAQEKETSDTDKASTEASPDDEKCLERLTQIGIRFEKHAAVKEKSCAIRNPVLVSALPNGVALQPSSLMACTLAEGLSRWVGEVVGPEAETRFQAKPTKLHIATSYQCRDQRTGGKLSEHAFGNAVDVMSFEFDKHAALTIGAHADNSPEQSFQDTVRKRACEVFTTVLGPGSDAAHGDHLHVDMRARKASYRICQ
jgi:hypothetical protein